MHVPQAHTARGSAWTRIGRRATLSVAFLVAGVTTLVVLPGRSGPIAAALLISGAFAAWVAALMVDAIRAQRPARPATRGRRVFRKRPAVIAAGQRDDPRVQPGDYFSTGDALYRVEHLAGARVLVEDCRSGDLIDIDRETCAGFQRVKRSESR